MPPDTLPYYCYNSVKSMGMLLGTSDKTVFGESADIITEIKPSDMRLSVLYRIVVKQNAISKRAYDYFLNIKKNSENIGTIFAPIPSEIRGNITCITDKRKPAVGYIDVSAVTQKIMYISKRDGLYEKHTDCDIYTQTMIDAMKSHPSDPPPGGFIGLKPLSGSADRSAKYIRKTCADCRAYGTTQKPSDW